MKSNQITRKKLACAIAALSISSIATAQQPPVLEEVIVTAQKRAQDITEIPSSLQAFQGEELESFGFSELSAFLKEVPSATMANNVGGGAFNVAHMRGSGGLGQTGDGAVAYYLDDVPFVVLNNQFSPVATMYDLERLEVLRGPQGTIWGQGSMGGTIRYLVNDPVLDEFDARVRVSGGDVEDGEESYKLNGAVNIPVVKDKFALRIAGGTERRGGYAEAPDVNGDDLNREELDDYRVKALWNVSDSLEIKALYWHMETDQDYSNNLLILDPPTLQPQGGQKSEVGGESDIYSLSLDWEFSQFNLVSVTSYLEHEVPLTLAFVDPNAGPIRTEQEYAPDTFAQELRLVSNSDGPLDWITGIYYSDTDQDVLVNSSFLNPVVQATVGSVSKSEIDSEVFAVFGEVSYELLDGSLIPLFGIRYFEDDRSLTENTLRASGIDEDTIPLINQVIEFQLGFNPGFTSCAEIAAFGFNCETQLPEFSTDDTFDSWNPRFNLSWLPNDDGMLYINVAKGFRSGTLQGDAPVTAAAIDGVDTSQSLDSDSVWSYELGGKWSFFDNTLATEFAVYRAEYEDAQVLFATSTGVPASVQGGDYRADGVELKVTWAPLDGLTIAGAFSAIDSEWTDVDPQVESVVIGVEDGESVPYIPETDWNVSASYTGSFFGSNWNHFEFLGYSERDEQFDYSGVYSGKVKSLDARIGLNNENWQFTLYGINLDDERGPVLKSRSNVWSQRPREIGFSVEYNMR